MGAWGTGSFDNDDALDWLDELDDRGLDAVRDALSAAVDADEPGAAEGMRALAAAEVVATLAGRAPVDIPGEVTGWMAATGAEPTDELTVLALRAVDRVGRAGALRDAWAATGELGAWEASLATLRMRLS
jgi:hypothetical protein